MPDTKLALVYLKAVLACLPQGICVFDENLRLRVWNPGFPEALDLPVDTVREDEHFSVLMSIPAGRGAFGPGDPEKHVERLAGLAASFQPHAYELQGVAGRTYLVHGEALIIDEQVTGLIVTYTEITEQKQAEAKLREQHDLLHTVVESMPSAITLFDADLRLLLHNSAFQHLMEMPPSLLKEGEVDLETLHRFNAERGEYGPGDSTAIVGALMSRARHPAARRYERTRPNGRTIDVRDVPLADGGVISIYTDISERRASAEREQLAHIVFTHTPSGVILTDAEQRILSINPAAIRMTGYEPHELLGLTVFSLLQTDTPPDNRPQDSLALRGAWSGETQLDRKNGEHFPASVNVNRVDDPHSGLPSHYVWILADITELKEAEARMRHIAQHDPLTGLPNRLALLMRLAQLLPEARRHGWRLAMMFIDLDRFKIINDTLGHQIGDELLREVARRLSSVVRETDFVARLGGDEFVVILPAIASPTDAALVAAKIINALASSIEADDHELHTSPSIGISLFPDDGPDGDTILKNADTAMYHAKAAGRNNYQFFAADMNKAATLRLDIERKLRQALSRQELSLCYQPQFDAHRNRPTGVEALIRWRHPVDGLIPPDQFIPVAEETGMIVEIGEWIMLNACREMKRWIDDGLAPLRIAVNVSARQLRRRDFCEAVAGVLADSGLAPELLELEITESSIMENPQEAIKILESLGRMGVSLAIDDFGTGYSSLAYLKLFPIDHLKIDRSFVRDIEHDLNDRAIAFGTIALAHSLGLNVIAEGVESDDQLELLRSNGCDEVQGYLFSKPLDSPAAFAFLHARSRAE